MEMNSIADEIRAIKAELPEGVELIAVSKFKPKEDIMEAYRAGQRLFGENRPQEMAAKAKELPSDIQWHFIGTLQRNKLKMVLPYAYLIHSVDSERLFDDIVKHAPDYCTGDRKCINILLQYRIASEDTKQGFGKDEILALLDRIAREYPENPAYSHVCIMGLMGMASFVEEPYSEEGRSVLDREFSMVQDLFGQIKSMNLPFLGNFTKISMGMSSDYRLALEHGTTYVRIGTRIFGARNTAGSSAGNR